ncbi:MAG: beta-propeller fold lactonase family protein [Ginsengibacter sp.]
MKKYNSKLSLLATAIILLVTSCNKNQDKMVSTDDHPASLTETMMSENGSNPDETTIADQAKTSLDQNKRFGSSKSGHYLYTESNENAGNNIMVYSINYNGSLQWNSNTASGGMGTGAPLGSQGALTISKDHKWLFAVNASSNTVSSFSIHDDGSLMLVCTKKSWGKTPVSVSNYHNMLYVLNRGSDNIHGFWVGNDGMLSDIDGSTKPLSGMGVDAPQISFTPDGDFIVVPEKATNMIGTFKLMNDGTTSHGIFNPSVGHTPFGFEFARNKFMIISNAEMGAAGAGTGTSYTIWPNGKIKDVNGARPNYQAAPCWVAVTMHGRFAYMTNTATNNISSYYVAPWGGLYLAESSAAETGKGPLDIVVADNNFYVYVLNSGSNNISIHYRKLFGQLGSSGTTKPLPKPTTGLATF